LGLTYGVENMSLKPYISRLLALVLVLVIGLTALNSLAGYYTAYGSRPIPDKLKQRLKQEFKQVQFSLQKGI